MGSGSLAAGVNPSIAAFNAGSGAYDDYSGVSGPTSFGIGGPSFPASSSTGNPVSIFGQAGELRLPQGYLTGGPLSGTFTFNNATFAGLGVTQFREVQTDLEEAFMILARDATDAGETANKAGAGRA